MEHQVVADYPCPLGEGPVWHPIKKQVYWTDIKSGQLYWFDPATGHHGLLPYSGPMVGGFTVQADGALLLFREKGNVVIWRDGKVLKTIIEQIPGQEHARFNDVWADPHGRVFCGTLGFDEPIGRFYRLDPDGTLTTLLDEVACSNGMGMTPDGKSLYYTETGAGKIWLFDYDRATGRLDNQRTFFEVDPAGGMPDGMAIDAAGRVWSALWGGWGLNCIGPDGRPVASVRLPARCVTSICFAGDRFSQMYVTTAGGEDRTANGPYAGALFRIKTDVGGAAEFVSRVGLEGRRIDS